MLAHAAGPLGLTSSTVLNQVGEANQPPQTGQIGPIRQESGPIYFGLDGEVGISRGFWKEWLAGLWIKINVCG